MISTSQNELQNEFDEVECYKWIKFSVFLIKIHFFRMEFLTVNFGICLFFCFSSSSFINFSISQFPLLNIFSYIENMVTYSVKAHTSFALIWCSEPDFVRVFFVHFGNRFSKHNKYKFSAYDKHHCCSATVRMGCWWCRERKKEWKNSKCRCFT